MIKYIPTANSNTLVRPCPLFCTHFLRQNLIALFPSVAGQTVGFDGTGYRLMPQPANAGDRQAWPGLFGFEAVALTITDAAVVHYGAASGARSVRRFVVRDRARFAEGMTQVTASLLARFPVRSGTSRDSATPKTR